MDFGLFLAFFLLLFHLLPLSSQSPSSTCPANFRCENFELMNSKFPYTGESLPYCDLCTVECKAKLPPKIAFSPAMHWFDVMSINKSTVKLRDPWFQSLLDGEKCESFEYDIGLPDSHSIGEKILQTITLFKCNITNSEPSPALTEGFSGFKNYDKCIHHPGFTIYYQNPPDHAPPESLDRLNCTPLNFPVVYNHPENIELFQLLTAEFDIEWHVLYYYYKCHREGNMCETEWMEESRCAPTNAPKSAPNIALKKGNKNLQLILGTVIPGVVLIFLVVVVLLIYHRKKGINVTSYFLSRNTSEPSSKPDLESGSIFFGVPIFTYAELQEATNNFDASKELGDGGFGTVYYGKLLDGRDVAVKRLYEHNFKRMEQFMNEIEILTRLRHRNLVSLYGCTSRHSRELLLVYEYIPNGTVADHLHGDRAQDKCLTWTHRMNIAIETADALAYLHKSDIIHRDVKTNNILLDHKFCVKVADFGLSRLFPNDVSHISTAPQGTPGYVDPEYHQCYQLTDKSDVYSFGVVLIELISSMPAVDISRHRHEINLANLAINRIQRCAFDELIDPSIGYKTNTEIMRMTTSVAELAFRCVQLEKEMRPSMEEVLETLKEIQNPKDILVDKTNEPDEEAVEYRSRMAPSSPESEDSVLLKDVKFSPPPNSVADAWVSSSTTTSTSR